MHLHKNYFEFLVLNDGDFCCIRTKDDEESNEITNEIILDRKVAIEMAKYILKVMDGSE